MKTVTIDEARALFQRGPRHRICYFVIVNARNRKALNILFNGPRTLNELGQMRGSKLLLVNNDAHRTPMAFPSREWACKAAELVGFPPIHLNPDDYKPIVQSRRSRYGRNMAERPEDYLDETEERESDGDPYTARFGPL